MFLLAFGYRAGVDGLIVAFGLAYVLAAIPITPAGLGVVEATMIALLTFFGADRGIATLGVVSYRLINFWLPIPLGALAYLSLQVEQETPEGRRRIDERRKATELRRLAERSLREVRGPPRLRAERPRREAGPPGPPSDPSRRASSSRRAVDGAAEALAPASEEEWKLRVRRLVEEVWGEIGGGMSVGHR